LIHEKGNNDYECAAIRGILEMRRGHQILSAVLRYQLLKTRFFRDWI